MLGAAGLVFEVGDIAGDLVGLLAVLASASYADYHAYYGWFFAFALPASIYCIRCRFLGLRDIMRSGRSRRASATMVPDGDEAAAKSRAVR